MRPDDSWRISVVCTPDICPLQKQKLGSEYFLELCPAGGLTAESDLICPCDFNSSQRPSFSFDSGSLQSRAVQTVARAPISSTFPCVACSAAFKASARAGDSLMRLTDALECCENPISGKRPTPAASPMGHRSHRHVDKSADRLR
jgi:hypothetical protein